MRGMVLHSCALLGVLAVCEGFLAPSLLPTDSLRLHAHPRSPTQATKGRYLAQGGARGGLRMQEDEGDMSWWEAPRRIVEVDGGMRAKGLFYWLADDHGVDMSKIRVEQSPVEGLGVFAAADYAAGESLFSLPRSCTIYPELVFEDMALGGSMKKLASASGTGVETVALATFLAKEKMRGSESSFRPYIECLPWDSLHPLMWTEDEVDLLKGTYAYDAFLSLRDEVDSATEIFSPVLNPKGWKQVFQPIDGGNLDDDDFAFLMRGAYASVLSRAYTSDMGKPEGSDAVLEDRVMLPLLDVFNHATAGSGGSGATVTFDATTCAANKYTIPTNVASGGGVKEGDELLSYYGSKPNWNMLTSYGFVSDAAESQESTLSASLDESDPLFSNKRGKIEALGMVAEDQLFDIQAAKPPSPKMMAYMRIATAESETELAGDAEAGELSESNEASAKSMLSGIVQRRREFLEKGKTNAVEQAKRGAEGGVRRDVARTVCSLLDSEGSALDTLTPMLS